MLGKIIADQTAIVEFCKMDKRKPPQILIVVDDMADRSDVLNRRAGARNGGSHIMSLAAREGIAAFRGSVVHNVSI